MLTISRFVRLAVVGALCASATANAAQVGAQTSATVSPSLFSGLAWRCIGPFDGGPVSSVTGVAGEAGIYVITTPSGGAWKTTDGGDTWTTVSRESLPAAESDPHQWTDRANPRRIVRTNALGIEVSLDGGATWIASHHLPIAEIARLTPREHQAEAGAHRSIAGKPVNVSIVDPAHPGLIFAGTSDSVYVSFDAGAHWESLRLNLPSVAINDLDIRGNNLVAATEGRSIWQLDDISPLRQLTPASASAAAILFKAADAVRPFGDATAESSGAGVALDYYIGAGLGGDARGVTLEILEAAGRVVHAASSSQSISDRWLPVMRPLDARPGQHRAMWNLHVDPPPAMKHQYAQLARAMFEEMPPDPDGPRVPAGTYRVRFMAGGGVYTQSLVVRNDARETPAMLASERQQFEFAMKVYDAMDAAHRGFLQLASVRAALRPLLASQDPDVSAQATALDTRLKDLDGSDWTGLVIPDADDNEAGEVDEKEGKHPDFVAPKPVSISKDYDDPTSILGRNFANVDHAPAFATTSSSLGDLLTKVTRSSDAPDPVAIADYDRSCQQLSGVLDTWKAMKAQDVPAINADLVSKHLPTLPIAAGVPALACGVKIP